MSSEMSPRCDRCGLSTAATWWVCLQSGGELHLCGHHMDEHREALDSMNAVMVPIPEGVTA